MRTYAIAALALALIVSVLTDTVSAQAKKNPRQIEAELQLHNAARLDRGGRITVEPLGAETILDRNTIAHHSADGNVHSRCVVINPPYAFTIQLVDTLPVTQVNFICSDYRTEQSPKNIVIELSDGTKIEKTLEVLRPASRGDKPRQTVAINKNLDWVKVTVLDYHPGGVNSKGQPINWGGIGEIEVITSADLTPYLTVPDFDPDMPVFIEGASPRSDYSNVQTVMPPVIALGQHPGIYLSRDEILSRRDTIRQSEWSAAMYQNMISQCDGWLEEEIVHPDPAIPAQMKNRGDAQAGAHDFLSKKAGWFGWAYQMTDDDRYAEKAREILIGYARLYPNDYKEHRGVNGHDSSKVMAQRLSEAMWLIPLIQSYDMIYNARCMTDDDRKLIEEDLIRHAVRFINRKRSATDEVASRDQRNPNWREDYPKPGTGHGSNWLLFYNMAYVQAGIVLQDQNWIDIGRANVRALIATGIKDDGMWGEGAIGYQLFARHALIGSMEALARKGYDLYGFADSRAKNLWDSSLKYAYPDGTAPGINDSGRASVASGWYAMAYDYGYLRYNDPNYGSLVNNAPRQIFQSQGCYIPTLIYEPLPEQEMQGLTSLVFDSLGYGILRGNDGGEKTFLLMDYGVHGGTHGHPDKLNLILFADGDELAGEPQPYRYENQLHSEWTRPTIAHWTMSVDMQSQSPNTGKLIAFYDHGDIKVMRGVSGKSYAGVGLDRTVVQMPGYILDLYRGWGATGHQYDYPLCFRGELDKLQSVDDGVLKPMGIASQRGYKHILALDPFNARLWSGTWQRAASEDSDEVRPHPANRVKATVLMDSKEGKVFEGKDVDGRHRVVFRQEGKDVAFAACIEPYKAVQAVASIEPVVLTPADSGRAVRVNRTDGGVDLIVVRFGNRSESTVFAGGETNGLVSVLRFDASGKLIEMGQVGGTAVRYQDQQVEVSEPGIKFMD